MPIEHFNQLTPAEQERLSLLAEECAEVIQVVGKILRHGFNSDNEGRLLTSNRRELETELGHVLFAQSLLTSSSDIDFAAIHRSAEAKKVHIRQYLHHQEAW